MRTSAATPIIVIIVGSIACVAAIALIFGLLIRPTQDKIAEETKRYNDAYQDSTAAAQQSAKDKLTANQATAQSIRDQWTTKDKALMPRFDVEHRGAAWNQLSYELSDHLGQSLERWMSHSGVTPLSGISIGAPPPSPNQIDGAPRIIPFSSGGQVSVGGDFRSLLAHVLKWNDFNRLVLIDRLALHGNSPTMNATYTAEVIIFPQNGDKLGDTVKKSGTGSGSAMGGGFPGGGFPGGGPPPGTIPAGVRMGPP